MTTLIESDVLALELGVAPQSEGLVGVLSLLVLVPDRLRVPGHRRERCPIVGNRPIDDAADELDEEQQDQGRDDAERDALTT